MLTCICVAVCTFVALLVVLISVETGRVKQTIALSKVRLGYKNSLVLAAVTGLLTALPVALSTGRHTVSSFLVRESVCASVIAFGTLIFALIMARVAASPVSAGHTDSDNWEPYERGPFGQGPWHTINPANGLPMNGSLDVAGNPFGCDFHSHRHSLRSHWHRLGDP
jgi:hypothetical protein